MNPINTRLFFGMHSVPHHVGILACLWVSSRPTYLRKQQQYLTVDLMRNRGSV